MSREITRRELLRIGAGFCLGSAVTILATKAQSFPPTGVFIDDLLAPRLIKDIENGKPVFVRTAPALTREGALKFGLRIAQAIEKLELSTPPSPRTIEEAGRFAQAIVPYFKQEGITNAVKEAPEIVSKRYYGEDYFYVSGAAKCRPTRISLEDERARLNISLNERYFNEYSSWSKKNTIGELTHELAHMQNICDPTKKDTETTAQLATVEVLAAMTKEGSIYTLFPCLLVVNRFVKDFLHLEAIKSGDFDWFEKEYLQKLPNPEQQVAWFERIYSNIPPAERVLALEEYGGIPYQYMIESIINPGCMTPTLDSLPNREKRFKMDDTKWVLYNKLN